VRRLLFSIACAALSGGVRAGAPEPAGEWDSPLGRVRIAREGEAVKGVLVSSSKLCAFRAGDEVLRGTLVDDSVAGQLRACLTGVGCPAEAWESALLLVAPGKLSGAVHVAEKGCRAPFGKKGGVTFAAAAAGAKPPAEGRPPRPSSKAAASTARHRSRERAQRYLKDGAAWLSEGTFERARARFLEAIEADPGIPEAYNGVGVTYRMRSALPEALAWYKRALALDPDFGDAYYNMACVYALQGERTLALRYLQIAAMNGYATAEGIDGDSDLASLRGTREYRALRDRM
jgi:hypothetical protein